MCTKVLHDGRKNLSCKSFNSCIIVSLAFDQNIFDYAIVHEGDPKFVVYTSLESKYISMHSLK